MSLRPEIQDALFDAAQKTWEYACRIITRPLVACRNTFPWLDIKNIGTIGMLRVFYAPECNKYACSIAISDTIMRARVLIGLATI